MAVGPPHAKACRAWRDTRRAADAVRRTVEAAAELGVPNLTLYAFSSGQFRKSAKPQPKSRA